MGDLVILVKSEGGFCKETGFELIYQGEDEIFQRE